MTTDQYQYLFDVGCAGVLLLVCIGLIYLISPADAITIAQGDIVYMNETVDISQAASWPLFQLAWCSLANTDCEPPDLIIDAAKYNLEKFYIDPAIFKYGTYYRWDGAWHEAENSVAFRVIHGRRSTTVAVNNTTDNPLIRPPEPEGPFNYLVARGDTATLTTRINAPDTCHLWLFTNTPETYNLPLQYSNGTYSTVLNSTVTYAIEIGKYAGYIQCDGNNRWQDVYYEKDTLDTPYDDHIVADVPIMTWNRLNVKRQFDELILTVPKFDDLLTPVTIEVSDPTITVTDVQQDENKLFVSGVTTWAAGTSIQLRLDPDNYPLSRDMALHTWQTSVSGAIDAPRTFSTALPFDKSTLAIGSHEIEMKAQQNVNTAISSYAFKVSDIYVMPTPTPAVKRMIYGKSYENIPVKIEPTPTPTPNVTEDNWEEFVYITPEPTANATATVTATPKSTAAPKAEQTIPTIPLGPLAVAGLAIALVMRRNA